MDSESTVNLLIKDIDGEVIDNDMSIINANELNTTDPEEPLNLSGSNSNGSLDSVKHINLSHGPEHISDTSINTDSPLDYELAAPVKVFSDKPKQIVTPDLKASATEVMSGPTLASAANRVYMNRSPTSSTERLRELLTEEADDIESEIEKNAGILTNPTAPKRFSLGSTKPLLSHPEENNSIMRYETASDHDELDNTFDTVSNDLNQQSPLVKHSPFKIPVTNIICINQFMDSERTKEEELSQDSFTSTKLDRIELHTSQTSSKINLVDPPARQPPSIPPTPEMRPLIDSELLQEDNTTFSKKFNTRVFSLATTIGDYQSAVEQQGDMDFIVPQTEEKQTSESEMIDTLNISASIDDNNERESTTSDNVNDTILGTSLPNISRTQLNTTPSNDSNSNTSLDESESLYKIALENDKQMEYTNKQIEQTENKIEQIINRESPKPVKKLPVLSTEVKPDVDTGHSAEMMSERNNKGSRDVASDLQDEVGLHKQASNVPMEATSPLLLSFIENEDSVSKLVSEPDLQLESKVDELEESLPDIDIEITNDDQQSTPEIAVDTFETNKVEITEENQEAEDVIEPLIKNASINNVEVSEIFTDKEEKHDIKTGNNAEDINDAMLTVAVSPLPEVIGFEPLTLESPFDADFETSFGSSNSGETNKLQNYLNVWHIQESSHTSAPQRANAIKPIEAPKAISRNVSSYSFKPTLVHRSKIHYSDSIPKMEKKKSSFLDDDCNISSLATDFEYLLNQIGTEDNSFGEENNTFSYSRLKIWNKDKDVLESSFTRDKEVFKDGSAHLNDVIGEDEDGIIKSQVKNVVVGKGPSIKSFTVDSDHDYEYSETNIMATPKKESVYDDRSYENANHINSPFKVVNSSAKSSPVKNIGENPFFTSSSYAIEKMEKPKIAPKLVKIPTRISHVPETSVTPAIINSNVEQKDELEEFITLDISESNPPDRGLVYINLDKIKLELSDIERHKPTFSLEIDNGINVVKTPWKSLSSNGSLDLGKELEIPVRASDEIIYLTLKCRYTRPEFELYEVMEKVKIGKRYHGLGKSNFKYEKRYKQKKLQTDDWDYIFAPDGSFATTELHLNEEFLNSCKFKEVKQISFPLNNKWGTIKQSSQNSTADSKSLKRRPYVIGNISLDSCYLQRTSNLERFPKSLNIVHDMIRRLKVQSQIKKEGSLLQEGGDIQGLLEKRYFKLEGNTLTGYHAISRKAKIDVNLLKAVDVIDNNDFRKQTATGRDFTNLVLFGESFKIIFNDGETISFNSDTSAIETRDWYNKIKESIALNVVHQPWVKRMIEMGA
ncbi:Bud site selection protein bud4 [Maudiozyma exigua]|uniref:Bud site selection protein bud4 n=1 Tax=Maudiozyma exigua TaxID=34358 RepID=A0A9P6WCA8_MAUEX|nr:Bud site selection protein bud4 [Kazachstania exigua]